MYSSRLIAIKSNSSGLATIPSNALDHAETHTRSAFSPLIVGVMRPVANQISSKFVVTVKTKYSVQTELSDKSHYFAYLANTRYAK
jgi:hypothetical protein